MHQETNSEVLPTAPGPACVWGGSKVPPALLVIFGASGDLSARKLIPALFGSWGPEPAAGWLRKLLAGGDA